MSSESRSRPALTSVMYDGSALPFAQNAAKYPWFCDMAHAAGGSVEAELGSWPPVSILTRAPSPIGRSTPIPNQAAVHRRDKGRRPCRTVGTVQWPLQGQSQHPGRHPPGDHERAGIRWSLHGGSGIPEETITAASTTGSARSTSHGNFRLCRRKDSTGLVRRGETALVCDREMATAIRQ